MGKPYDDPDLLRELYHDKGLTQQEVADHIGCSKPTIIRRMKKFDIQTRDVGGGDPNAPHKNEENIRSLYIDNGLTVKETAEELGIDGATLRYWMDKFGIERRSKAGNPKNAKWNDEEWLIQQYVEEEKSCREIAKEAGCSDKEVRRRLHKHGVEMRSTGYHNRRNSAHYYTDPYGYEVWQSGNYANGEEEFEYVRVHRLAAVAWFGLDAIDNCDVHHASNIPWDNREANLIPLTKSEHMTHHNRVKS